jgi:hypothetical protein
MEIEAFRVFRVLRGDTKNVEDEKRRDAQGKKKGDICKGLLAPKGQ